MRNKIYAWCCYIASISAIVILLITSIDIHCFNRGFFESEYASMDTATQLHMTQTDLMKATNTLLDYLQDQRDDIEVVITERGMETAAFNERESQHMVDVKNLYQNALHARTIAIVLFLLSFIVILWKKRNDTLELLAKGYAQIATFFVCFVGFLGIWAAVDFTSLWESFHRLFFTNDLWLLNPRTDLMINMFPEDFFFHMVLRIAGTFLIGFLIPLGISIYYLNRKYHFIHRYNKGKTSV